MSEPVPPVESDSAGFSLPPDSSVAEDSGSAEPSPSTEASPSTAPQARKSGKSLNLIILGVVAAGLLGLGGIAGLYFTRPRGAR